MRIRCASESKSVVSFFIWCQPSLTKVLTFSLLDTCLGNVMGKRNEEIIRRCINCESKSESIKRKYSLARVGTTRGECSLCRVDLGEPHDDWLDISEANDNVPE